MKQEIQELENQLEKLKKAYEIEQQISYEKQLHKHFDEGDIVTNGKDVGIVGWTENVGCDFPYNKGYAGISLISGNRGFGTYKRDEWDLVKDDFYTTSHKIEIDLTGLEIEDLKYVLGSRNVNPNKTKSKLLDLLDSIAHTNI